MELVRKEDIAKLSCLNHLVLSPDQETAVFTEITPDLKENKEHRNLYVLVPETGKVSQLTSGNSDDMAVFEDDRTILFMSGRKESETDPHSSFYRIDVNGGEAVPAFELDEDVEQIWKLPEGKYLLKICRDRYRPDPKEKASDVHVAEEIPVWANGRGFVAGKRSGLFLFDPETKELKAITDQNEDTAHTCVYGSEVLWISRTFDDILPQTSTLKLLDTSTGEKQILVPEGVMRVSFCTFTDKAIVFAGTDMKPWGLGQLCDFYQVDPKTGTYFPVHQNAEELAIGDTPLTDTLRPSGTVFAGSGSEVYFTAMCHTHTDLYKLSADGEISEAADAEGGVILNFAKTDAGLITIQAPVNGLSQVCVNGKCVYDPNASYLREHVVSPVKKLSFTNRNGDIVEGFYLEPAGATKEQAAGVLEIHGGPRCAYGLTFYHEMQTLAADGYFVFFCNPHGSEGYGEAYADLRGKYGTIDYEDLMDFTDEVLKQLPIDPERIGAGGGSYGGFMSNWIEGHTDRFAAIVSQRSVSNWVSDFGASEIGVSFDSNEMAADPWSDMQAMWKQSPLAYADHAKTPILFLHSLCDYNCTIDQGMQMYTAMKYFHVPARMVLFEGENHGLSRSGKPQHRIRRLKEMTEWFHTYLEKGEGNGEVSC